MELKEVEVDICIVDEKLKESVTIGESVYKDI